MFSFPHSGAVKEFLCLPVGTGRSVLLLDLHCVACTVERDDVAPKRTKDWMTEELWNETLALLTPIAEKRMRGDVNEANLAEREAAQTAEGSRVRLACVFRRCSEAQSVKFLVSKTYLYGYKLVASVALASDESAENTVRVAVGMTAIEQEDESVISKYFVKD
jgi:hypothetical protein